MTLVLLDTNAYLRLAKRIRPLLGQSFGQKGYVLTILKDVEDEVRQSPRLRFCYPWFSDLDLSHERSYHRVRLSQGEKDQINAMTSVLQAHVQEYAQTFTSKGRSPPSLTDCYCLAFGQVRPAIVATDDLGMHKLAKDFGLQVFHCYDVLHKMLSARLIDKEMVSEIYQALEDNNDLPRSWEDVKHTRFKKVFGKQP